MCGRFTLTAAGETLQAEFSLDEVPQDFPARFNIAPTQPVAVVVNNNGIRQLDAFRWGLIPFWAKDKSTGSRMINARAETVAEKTSFKRPLQKQRCLILADGFYEWQKTPQGKIPTYIHLKNRKPFAFAGLWDSWTGPEGEKIPSCTIITTGPNSLMQPIHNRMPVILLKADEAAWLNPVEQAPQALLPLLKAYPPEEMAFYPVSRFVNSPANDSPNCIHPV